MLDMKIPINLTNLTRSFLSSREFRVRVDDVNSSTRKIMAGVPQGSCLSPLLFSIFINDIPTLPGTKTNLFANDTMFYSTSMGKHHSAKNFQNQVDIASIWLKYWRVLINPNKTKAILFGDQADKSKTYQDQRPRHKMAILSEIPKNNLRFLN